MDKLEKNMIESSEWKVHFNGAVGYEVKKGKKSYAVDLNRRTCACKACNVSGIPCCHAICAILDKKEDPKDYIHEWYHKDKYIETYKHTLNPINGPDEWKKYGMKKLLLPWKGNNQEGQKEIGIQNTMKQIRTELSY